MYRMGSRVGRRDNQSKLLRKNWGEKGDEAVCICFLCLLVLLLHVTHRTLLLRVLCHAPFGVTDASVTGAAFVWRSPWVTVSIFVVSAILVWGASISMTGLGRG